LYDTCVRIHSFTLLIVGTMKISLVFGLARQRIEKLWIVFGMLSKRSCSSRRMQTWNTRRTRTRCRTSRPLETHKSGSQSRWRAGRHHIRIPPLPARPPVVRARGANERPSQSPWAGTWDAGAKPNETKRPGYRISIPI
jgi:hypothetical protein